MCEQAGEAARLGDEGEDLHRAGAAAAGLDVDANMTVSVHGGVDERSESTRLHDYRPALPAAPRQIDGAAGALKGA